MPPQYVPVHPRAFHTHTTAAPHQSSLAAGDSNYLAQLEVLLREHEPHKVHQARDLLRIYAGMERELLQCYRHHYTGNGGFRVANSTASRHATTVFSLPKAAIATYLREKLRARRSSSSSTTATIANSSSSNSRTCAKGEDVRSPEMLLLPAVQRSASTASASRHRNALASSSSTTSSGSGGGCAVRPLPKLLCPASRPPTAAARRP